VADYALLENLRVGLPVTSTYPRARRDELVPVTGRVDDADGREERMAGVGPLRYPH